MANDEIIIDNFIIKYKSKNKNLKKTNRLQNSN
jgi:hypothetical protein